MARVLGYPPSEDTDKATLVYDAPIAICQIKSTGWDMMSCKLVQPTSLGKRREMPSLFIHAEAIVRSRSVGKPCDREQRHAIGCK